MRSFVDYWYDWLRYSKNIVSFKNRWNGMLLYRSGLLEIHIVQSIKHWTA